MYVVFSWIGYREIHPKWRTLNISPPQKRVSVLWSCIITYTRRYCDHASVLVACLLGCLVTQFYTCDFLDKMSPSLKVRIIVSVTHGPKKWDYLTYYGPRFYTFFFEKIKRLDMAYWAVCDQLHFDFDIRNQTAKILLLHLDGVIDQNESVIDRSMAE